jgi:HNH endonuclease
MTDISRPSIPAEIKRRVLVEAGHRCAIPTCRYINVEIHHIVPWESCQSHDYQNLIALCPNCHLRADRGNIDRKSLRIYKASLRFTHDRFSQFEVDILVQASQLLPNQGIPYPRGMELLVKRLLDANFVSLHESQGGMVRSLGIRVDPIILIATEAGHTYYNSLGLETLDWSAEDA